MDKGAKRPPQPPPAYRPQAVPKCLQTKAALPHQKPPVRAHAAPPPVQRPQPTPQALQRNAAAPGPRPAVVAPSRPPHRPSPAPLQPKATAPIAGARAAAPPRGSVQRFTQRGGGGVIQCTKLDYSQDFVDEKKKHHSATRYFKNVVAPWLYEKKKDKVKLVRETAEHVLRKEDTFGKGRWDTVKHLIDWVNRAIDGGPKSTPEFLLGVPQSKLPKIGLKYADREDYFEKKGAKQRGIRPMNVSHIEGILKNATNGQASDVRVRVTIDGKLKIPEDSNVYESVLSTPFGHTHEGEIYDSRKDGEVLLLSNALNTLVQDLSNSKSKHLHGLMLVGPFGACDGCKDRLKKFKRLWLEAKLKAQAHDARLLITYFYRSAAAPGEERPKSMYGWKEARQETFTKGGGDYYYWSTRAK